RRGDRITRLFCCGCSRPVLAQSGVSLRRECLAAIGGEADIAHMSPACRCGAIDPKRTLATAFCCDARCYNEFVILSLGVSPMRRRDFIALLGSNVAAWPLAARAQQSGKLPIIGFLGANTPSVQSQWTAAFVQRLRELGWIEGRNVAIEYRWAEGRFDRSPEIIAEFIRLKVDVIVTHGTANVVAAKQATSVIPIAFATLPDPVGDKVVASLARPGGNVTGLSNQAPDLA